MKLSDIFDALSSSELSQVKLGGTPLKQIQPEHVKELLVHINLGMQDLYRKFTIVKGEVTFKLKPGVYTYVLDVKNSFAKALKDASDWSAKNPTLPVPIIDPDNYYIQDGDSPFLGDINKIEELLVGRNKWLPINDSNVLSARNNKQLELIIPHIIVDEYSLVGHPERIEYITAKYRAKPVEVKRGSGDFFDVCSVDVPLPDLYMQALIYFIASRILTPIGSVDEYKPGDNYTAKYMQECQSLTSLGFELSESNTPNTLRRRGFV